MAAEMTSAVVAREIACPPPPPSPTSTDDGRCPEGKKIFLINSKTVKKVIKHYFLGLQMRLFGTSQGRVEGKGLRHVTRSVGQKN